jgi:hypothetical protein
MYPNCTHFATEDAVRIGNPFITIPITRHYNRSQLSTTLLCVYTNIILTRSYLHSLITLLHWLTSQLSITVSNYLTHCIFTLRNSRRDLTPRIHFLRRNSSLLELLLKHWLLHSHSGNWTEPSKSSAYKPSIVLPTRAVLRRRVYSSVASETLPRSASDIIAAARRNSARWGSVRHGTAHRKPVT